MDNCLEWNCQLTAGKEYETQSLKSDPAQDLHYQSVLRMVQEDLVDNEAAHSHVKFVYH